MSATDYAAGYQEALRDVARAWTQGGATDALIWMEDNMIAHPVRDDIARLSRVATER